MKKVTSRWPDPALGVSAIIFSIFGAVFLTLGLALSLGLRTQLEEWYVFLCVFGGQGALFLIVGVIFFLNQNKKLRRKNELIARGCYVMAQFVGVHANYNVQRYGNCMYQALCRYQAPDGTTHLFRSSPMWTDPTSLLQDDQIKVYVDGGAFDRYYVAMEEALQNVHVH